MNAVLPETDPLQRIAEGWLNYQRAAQFGPEGVVKMPVSDELFEFVEQVDELVRKEPEVAWVTIQLIFVGCKNDIERACLAAGPLEDLLAKHGLMFIDRVETVAASNPDFRELLAGVWRNTIAAPVWERLQQALGGSA